MDPIYLTSQEQRMLLRRRGSLPTGWKQSIRRENSFPALNEEAVMRRLSHLDFQSSPDAQRFAEKVREMHARGEALDSVSIGDIPDVLLAPFLACLGSGGVTLFIERILLETGEESLSAILSLTKFRHALREEELRVSQHSHD